MLPPPGALGDSRGLRMSPNSDGIQEQRTSRIEI